MQEKKHQKQEQPKTWRRPQLERLRVALDTESRQCGSGADYRCGTDPEKLFGSVD